MSPRFHEHVRNLVVTSKEAALRLWGKRALALFLIIGTLLILFALGYAFLFGPSNKQVPEGEFVVTPEDTLFSVSNRLEEEGYIKHAAAFRFSYVLSRSDRSVRPGGYRLASSMDALAIAKQLGEAPYLSWISIPEGKRKEEIGELLQKELGWSSTELSLWNQATVSSTEGLSEGVYFADTYLIPSDQPPEAVAARLRGRFDEAFAPYAEAARSKEKDPKDILILASIIEKEAGKNDKRLVAGILENRLDRGMLLQVDATLQYLRGAPGAWWPQPDPEDKDAESPFNTYKYVGLPPEPIVTPSAASIEAALNPQTTKCLYYLHDAYGRIHCTTTYQGHVANVNRYLR